MPNPCWRWPAADEDRRGTTSWPSLAVPAALAVVRVIVAGSAGDPRRWRPQTWLKARRPGRAAFRGSSGQARVMHARGVHVGTQGTPLRSSAVASICGQGRPAGMMAGAPGSTDDPDDRIEEHTSAFLAPCPRSRSHRSGVHDGRSSAGELSGVRAGEGRDVQQHDPPAWPCHHQN